MGETEKKTREIIQKSFDELEIGDPIFDQWLVDWNLVSLISGDVAEYLVIHCFSNSPISTKGFIPSEHPIKKWENGVGIVVATPTTIPGEERLNLLHKTGQDDFGLYLSQKIRKVSPKED